MEKLKTTIDKPKRKETPKAESSYKPEEGKKPETDKSEKREQKEEIRNKIILGMDKLKESPNLGLEFLKIILERVDELTELNKEDIKDEKKWKEWADSLPLEQATEEEEKAIGEALERHEAGDFVRVSTSEELEELQAKYS